MFIFYIDYFERVRERARAQHVCIPDTACSTSSCPLSIEFLPIISPKSQIHYMMHISVCLANTFLVKRFNIYEESTCPGHPPTGREEVQV